MKLRYLIAGVLVLAVSGCSLGSKARAPTLADLTPITEPVVAEPLPIVEWEQVWKSYEEVLADTANPALHAKSLRRLADLAVEGYGRDESAPTSDEEFQRAIEQYRSLLAGDAGELESDVILYQMARAYDVLGRPELALEPLTQLVEEFPNSPYYGETQYRRGEILFTLQNYRAAQSAYRAAVALWTDTPFYHRALYKYGWSMFKQGNYQDALLPFFMLFDDYLVRPEEEIDASERALLDDLHRVVSLSFSLMNGVDSVTEFFRVRNHQPYEARIYQHLAEFYVKQDLLEDAAKTYQTYASLYPQAPEAAGFLLRVVDIYQQGNFASQVLQAKVDFARQYGARQDYWREQPPANWEAVRPRLQLTVAELARHYHAQAQASGQAADYAQAVHWYEDYIRSFPADAQTPGLHFLMAEALAESGQMVEAIVAYETTAYGYEPHEKSAEAGYAAFLNYQQLLAQISDDSLLQIKQGAILSGRRFAGYYPQDPRVPTVQSRLAELLFGIQEDAEAVATAVALLEAGYPLTLEMQRRAWTIIAHGEFTLGDYPSSERASQQALVYWPAGTPEHADLIERQAAAIYRQGEMARAAEEFAAAAEHFLRIGQQTPQASIRVGADYDAAMALMSGKLWDRAIDALNGFMQRNPAHELYRSAEQQLAQAYEHGEQWSNVARVYERMLSHETDPERQSLLQWSAAELYEKGGEVDLAIDAYNRFILRFPAPLEPAIEARFKIAGIYQARGQTELRHQWLRRLIEAHRAGDATERTTYLAAKAELELAEVVEAQFRAVALKLPLKEALGKKKDLMQKTVAAYSQAMEYKIAEVTTASVYHLGQVYRHLAEALMKSERPKGMEADEVEMYDIMLEEQAFPFEEKALDIHESNYRRIAQDVYDDWVKSSMQALAELNPGRYAKQETVDGYINILF